MLNQLKQLDLFAEKRYFLLKEKQQSSGYLFLSSVIMLIGLIVLIYWDWESIDFFNIVLIWVGIQSSFMIYQKLNYEEPRDIDAFIPINNVSLSWYDKLKNIFWIAVSTCIIGFFVYNANQAWISEDFNPFEGLYYLLPFIVIVVNAFTPPIPSIQIYFQGSHLKFVMNSVIYYESKTDFQEIRLSKEMISMKSIQGKVDRLYQYNWTDDQLEQLKSFINKKAPHIEVLIID
ncbi:hypothetical protein BST92_00260 [Nonlabens arenilitoris]|uniref:Uncharacterized protein n=1 Tax=Nonlabens arenilitoris TaxID=1217969 RepID=A0A2S7U627_9FLAO|nr:hypothetical protein [Nonlabens arenilitoris]PQJ30466.1 hypothetical protein BST92_00260 [Nonlabens arenilitoris]